MDSEISNKEQGEIAPELLHHRDTGVAGNEARPYLISAAKYGIHQISRIDAVDMRRFTSIEAAKAEAKRIADEYRIEVLVFEIIGSYRPTMVWADIDNWQVD